MNDDKKTYNSFFLLGIGITLIAIIIFAYLAINIRNGDYCTTNQYTDYEGKPVTNSSYVLNSTNDYVLQEFYVNHTTNLFYVFCFHTYSATGATLSITDGDTSLATEYVLNGTQRTCTQISPTINYKVALGVSCPDCSATRNVTLLQETVGDDVKQIISADGVVSVTQDNTLAYLLYGRGDCKQLLKMFFGLYLILLAVLALIFGIVLGYKKFYDILFGA